MSDDAGSQVPTDEPKTEETIITDNPPEGEGGKGPEPIYKEDPKDEDSPVEEKPKEDPKKEEDPGEGDDGDDDKDGKGDDEDKVVESLDKPKDSLLSDSDMERILSQAKEEGLSKEDAQKQVALADSVLKSHAEKVADAHSELSDQWIQECKDDKEIGGEKFEESVNNAQKALRKFGTEKFIESLNDTKFGNNPEVVRVFARIGKAMSPDELILPGVESGSQRSLEQVFYGDKE